MPFPFSFTSYIFTSWKTIAKEKQSTRSRLIDEAHARLEKLDAELGAISEKDVVEILGATGLRFSESPITA